MDQQSQNKDLNCVAAETFNPSGRSPILLVCEHASHYFPDEYNQLGLTHEQARTHSAWDIGAQDVAIAMSKILDAPLVLSNVSRLVFDCNRPLESSSAIPDHGDGFDIAGNQNLSVADRRARFEAVYIPFEEEMQSALTRTKNPAIITIHSFTPVYFGKTRDVEIGILHDKEPALAQYIFDSGIKANLPNIEMNAPYSMKDGVTYTLAKYGTANELPNAMIEIRNDLISTQANAADMAQKLSAIILDALPLLETS